MKTCATWATSTSMPQAFACAVLAVDGRLQGGLDDPAQGRLALLDALDHRHVGDGVAQLAQADVREQGGDLPDTRPAAEVEQPRRRTGSVIR